jgi:hypothetical protein
VPSSLKVLPVAGNKLQLLYEGIFAALETELRAVNFLGPLGIDAFIYRDAAGDRRLKPIVEINPRYTMGRVTVELMKNAAQGSSGLFRLFNHAALRAGGCDDFVSFARKLREIFPLQISSEASRRISEGAVCLNDPREAQVCLAVFQVFRSMPELQRCAGIPSAALVKASR